MRFILGMLALLIALGGIAATGAGAQTATSGVVGNPAATQATQVGGRDGNGNLRALALGPNGGLMPGQATVASTLVTTVASASTTLAAQNNNRVAFEVQIETALTAPLYLCFNAQACSATVHDRMLPTGAAAGTQFPTLFGFASGATYFTTQAGVAVNVTSWAR